MNRPPLSAPRHSRRDFLWATVKSGAGIALAGCAPSLSSRKEAGARRHNLSIIDTHTHFYDPHRPQGVPWPPPDHRDLYRSIYPRDYLALPVPRPVTGTIVVEASPWVEDNQWVLDLAANDRFILGLVGNLPVGTKQFAGHLKRFAADPLFRGIRLRDRKLEGTLDTPAFVSDLRLLAEHDLSLDLVGGLDILPFAERLNEEIPNLRIIIDHLAGLRVDGKAPPADWERSMRPLAARPGIFFKVSGLVEGTGKADGSAPRDPAFYRPILNSLRDMFGPERLLYASNWPVSELFAPLATVQEIIQDYFSREGGMEQVFCLTAQAAYQWTERQRRV